MCVLPHNKLLYTVSDVKLKINIVVLCFVLFFNTSDFSAQPVTGKR